MIPGEFDYERPRDVGAVLQLLKEREGEAKLLAGGHSLLPLLKLRLASPSVVVDLGGIEGLNGIAEADGELRIGALATHRSILEHPASAAIPVLRDAAAGIGDSQVRNWGTIGGSVAHADPASDWPAVLLALRASVVCRSADAERVIAARDFFVDLFTTAIEPTELLTEVRIPGAGPRTGSAYAKLERRAGDFSTVGVAAQVSLGDDGRIAAAGLALTAVADYPFAAIAAEDALVGNNPTEAVIEAAAGAAARQSRPVDDAHGPDDYKRAMAAEMTRRALRRALERASA
jgi:aerobic carbon-monoxide dehydrogenase medium subunit